MWREEALVWYQTLRYAPVGALFEVLPAFVIIYALALLAYLCSQRLWL